MIGLDTPDFKRDRWGRPLVTNPDGNGTLAYGRPSSFGKCIDDDYNLQLWAKRKVLEGLVKDHAIYASACALTFDDTSKEAKAAINKVVEKALAAVRTDARAELGTALHKMTEKIDRGEIIDLPPVFRTDVDAYQKALAQAGFRVVPGMIELHCVCDELELAGSFDRLLEHIDTGDIYVGDLKTGGTVDYPHGYAVQLAVYANSHLYDVDSGQRSPMPERLDRKQGVIIHLPAGEGTCSVHYIDLVKGWKAAGVASWVKRDWQKDKGLLSPVVRIAPPAVPVAAVDTTSRFSEVAQPVELQPNADLYVRINALTDEQRVELKARWPKGVNLKRKISINDRMRVAAELDLLENPPVVTIPPDEGRDADPAAIAVLRQKTATLPGGGAQWLTRTIRGCELAGASISMKERESLRRFELCRALFKLAAENLGDKLAALVHETWEQAVDDDYEFNADPVALLASMGWEEATAFARLVDALVLDLADAAPRLSPVA